MSKRVKKILWGLVLMIMFIGISIPQKAYAKSGTVTKKKTITIYKGKNKTVKLKNFKKSKKIKIRVSGTTRVLVKQKKKNGGVLIKAKRTGTAKITITYTVRKKRYVYRMVVKVKKPAKKTFSKTSTVDKRSKEDTSKIKYKYDVKVISKGTIYNNALIYVKTDNPDGSFHFEKDDCIISTATSNYMNLPILNKNTGKVKNGYLVEVILEGNSENIISLYENDGSFIGTDTGIKVSIKTGDYEKDEDAWIEEIISRAKVYVKQGYYESPVGSKMLLPVDEIGEKHCVMRAIESMVLDEFKYVRTTTDSNGNGMAVYLYGEDDMPYWISKHITCLTSTHIMRKCADKLLLPNEKTYAGYSAHYYATVTIDGEEVVFDACPDQEKSIIEYGSWNIINIDSLANNSYAKITKK